MTKISMRLIFWLLTSLWLSSAYAGSRRWQPALTRSVKSSPDRLTRHGRRAAPLYSSSVNRVVWPNRKVRYCYESDAAKQALKTDVINAWEIWLSAGLNAAFTIEEVDDATCSDDRANVLLIANTDDDSKPKLAASVGFPGAESMARSAGGHQSNRLRGPVMYLTTKTDVGMLNTAFNYAHEWGHVWGLYHEHQNPGFWGGVSGASSGEVFGPTNMVSYNGVSTGNWMCENLNDYSPGSIIQGSSTQTLPLMCTSYVAAVRLSKSSMEYLPDGRALVSWSAGHKSSSVDWESIMLCKSYLTAGKTYFMCLGMARARKTRADSSQFAPDNSKAGGRGTVTSTSDDERLPILLQSDGSLIGFNWAPSIQDVHALETLYGLTQTKKSLLQKIGGDTTSKFKKLFNKSKESSSANNCL